MTDMTATLPVDAATRARIERLAEKSGRPVGALTQEAVIQYLDRQEAEMGMR